MQNWRYFRRDKRNARLTNASAAKSSLQPIEASKFEKETSDVFTESNYQDTLSHLEENIFDKSQIRNAKYLMNSKETEREILRRTETQAKIVFVGPKIFFSFSRRENCDFPWKYDIGYRNHRKSFNLFPWCQFFKYSLLEILSPSSSP